MNEHATPPPIEIPEAPSHKLFLSLMSVIALIVGLVGSRHLFGGGLTPQIGEI